MIHGGGGGRGEGGGTAIYGLYRFRCEEYGFQAVYPWDRVYKSECLGLEYVIIFQETDQLVEDFI